MRYIFKINVEIKENHAQAPEGTWRRPVQGDYQRFVPNYGTLTRAQRPPGFSQLQDIVREAIKENQLKATKIK
jgi:hypothetical protein